MDFKEQMTDAEVCEAVRTVFAEGYNAYATPCNAFNTEREAWKESGSRAGLVEVFGEQLVTQVDFKYERRTPYDR